MMKLSVSVRVCVLFFGDRRPPRFLIVLTAARHDL